jgi:hypothetical protein
MTPAVLFLRVPAVPPKVATAYEQWYDRVHIPYRMDKPHFLGAQRYDVLVGHQRYLVFYELSSPAALMSDEYLTLRRWEAAQPPDSFEAPGSSRPGFERGVYDQVAGPGWPAADLQAPIVHIAGCHPSDDQEDAFGAWMDSDHTQAVSRVPGVVAVRRFVLTRAQLGSNSGLRTDRPRFLTVSYLDSLSVADDPVFADDQARARAMAHALDEEPYVLLGRLVHTATAEGISLDRGLQADPGASEGERS